MTRHPWRESDSGRTQATTPQEAIDSWRSRLDAVRDLGGVAGELLAALARASEAGRGSLMLVNPHTGRLRIVAAVGLPDSMVGQDLVPAPRRISDWVLRERSAVIVNGEVNDQRFEGSAMRDRIASAMSIPLPGARGPIGVLNLARVAPASVFGAEELAQFESVAARLAELLERVQNLDRAMADWRLGARRNAQLATDPSWNGTRSCRAAVARVAGAEVAGDLFERVAHPDGGLTLMLADVLGKGAAALRIGDLTRGLFLAHARYHRSPAEIVRRVHESLLQDASESYVCLWVACVTRNGQLTSCGAGYPAAFCLPTDGVAGQRLSAGGPPAGVPLDGHYMEDRVRLLPGDAVVVVSDGVLGALSASGAAFGVERVEDLLHEHHRQPLDHLVRLLCDEALRFGGIAHPVDDLVALALRFSRED